MCSKTPSALPANLDRDRVVLINHRNYVLLFRAVLDHLIKKEDNKHYQSPFPHPDEHMQTINFLRSSFCV